MTDDRSYLWERCYRCGHRLAFASTACPQCGEGFDGRDDPNPWPDACDCDRCEGVRKRLATKKPRV